MNRARRAIETPIEPGSKPEPTCLTTRRQFLKLAGGTVVTLMIVPPWGGPAVAVAAQKVSYKRTMVGTVSDLVKGEPVLFHYPDRQPPYSENMLVKLGTPAGGGVGPEGDIVAFSTLCTHMGGILNTSYKGEHQVAGPCPVHLSTFDLTRHGMVVAGHATQSLPQVLLEVEGDTIFAIGMLGLMYGRNANT